MARVAREGLRFASCVVNLPERVPTRRAIASGLYAHNTHFWGNRQQRKVEFPNWISCIREAGYQTSLIGQAHLMTGGLLMALFRPRSALFDNMPEHGYSEADCGKSPRGKLYRLFSQVWM